MKKLILSIAVLFTLSSCVNTSVSQDTMMLQKAYPKAVVYRIDGFRYVIVDSISTLDIRVTGDGEIYTIIKIR